MDLGKYVVGVSIDCVRLTSVESDNEFECVSVGTSHSQDVKTVVWHPSRELVASASYDDTVKLWLSDEDSDWFVSETLDGHESSVWDLDFNSFGDQLGPSPLPSPSPQPHA